MNRFYNRQNIKYAINRFITHLSTLLKVATSISIIGLTILAGAQTPVQAYDTGDYDHCEDYWPTFPGGTECYIRGIYEYHRVYSAAADCWTTNRITYPDQVGHVYRFCDNRPDRPTGKEAIGVVRWNGNGSFVILSVLEVASAHNVPPNQPAISRPLSGWEMGPGTNGNLTGVSCNLAGTGQGCTVQVNTQSSDPDFFSYLRLEVDIKENSGGNKSYTKTFTNTDLPTNPTLNFTKTQTLTDGYWKVRARNCDTVVCSSYTSFRTFIVDTTSPTGINMVSEPEFTKGLQNTVNSTAGTDAIAGGIKYLFEYDDDAAFASPNASSGWISSNSFIFASLTDEVKYYYRVKSRDRLLNTTNWNNTTTSSTQDNTPPLLENIAADKLRISPENQDGILDLTQISLKWTELNPAEIKLEVLNSSNTVVNTTSKTTLTGLPTPVDELFAWDGKDDSAVYVPDGAYIMKITMTDKAGNITIDDNLIVNVDNTPANISVSTPSDFSWFNNPNIVIFGQTESNAQAWIINEQSSIQTSLVLDGLGLFSHNDTLELGLNEFSFDVLDTVSNTNNLGLTYYYETDIPSIGLVTPNTLINDRQPNVNVAIADFGYSDGLNTYISGVDPDTLYISLLHSTAGELILVNNGVNTQPALGAIQENCSTAGVYTNSTAENCTFSFNFTNDLSPDGDYTLSVNAKDSAQNSAVNKQTTFELDSAIQSDLSNPTNGNLLNYSLISLTGTSEENSEVTVTLPLGDTDGDLLIDTETILVDPISTNSSRTSITNCRNSASPDTDGIKSICDWQVDNFQLEKDSLTPGSITNDIRISSKDNINAYPSTGLNTKVENISVDVDLYAVSLALTTDIEYFSPNGDGIQDGINFIQIASNGQILSYVLEIKDTSGTLMKSFSGGGSLPASIPWDGRDASGTYVPDGDYEYQLKITTTDGIPFETPVATLSAATILTDTVVITYPKNNSFSSEGVINVQGQAPQSLVLSNGDTETEIKICVDTTAISGTCDTEYYTTVNSFGNFSTIVMLPRLNALDEHYITASAFDKYGNKTPESNQVKVTTTINPPFKSVEIIPVLTGTNDPTAYQLILDKLDAGQDITQTDIDSLRSVVMRSTVFQGTERVRLFFADHSQLSMLPAVTDWNSIGYITGDNTTKLYKTFQDGTTPYTSCASTTCTWDFFFPLIPQMQGLYEVRFEGKLDADVVNMTAGFTVDGNIPISPIILDINKEINGNFYNTNYFNNAFYSNSEIVQIRGASDPGASINVEDDQGRTICSTTASSVGIWSCEIDTSTIAAYSNPDTNNYTILLKTFATLGLNTTESVDNKTVIIDKIDPTISIFETDSYWRKSGDIVNLDIRANELLGQSIHIDSQNEPITDACINTTSTYENFIGLNLPIQSGAINDLIIDSGDRQNTSGSFTLSGHAIEGRYCTTIQIYDLAGNSTQAEQVFFIDNTVPDLPFIDNNGWGDFNGINTKSGQIAEGRLVPEFVHEEGSVKIKAWGEEDSTLELFVNNTLVSTTTALPGTCKEQTVDILSDTVLVQDKDYCQVEFSYQMTQNGKDYVFQVKSTDKSRNISIISEDEVVYFDNQKPVNPKVLRTFSGSYNPTPGWKSGKTTSITKDLVMTISTRAEALSDIEYWITGPSNFSYYQYGKVPGVQIRQQTISLNDKKDERNGCVELINTRRTGTCQDGTYSIMMKSTDAAGNASNSIKHTVNRDTVRPATPVTSVGIAGAVGSEKMSINISGEKYGTAKVKVVVDGRSSIYKSVALGSDGKYSTSNFLGNLACGNKEYTVITRIMDAAQNYSYVSTDSITTGDCPALCGYEGTMMAPPVRPDYRVSSGYKTTARPTHAALDMVKIGGTYRADIYSAGNGRVVSAKHTGGVNGDKDKANYVTVVHDDGRKTGYWHLDNETYTPVTKKERVNTQNSILGHMGDTGYAFGIHLHFIVWIGGERVNPNYFLEGNANISCKEKTEESDDDDDEAASENPQDGIKSATPDKPWANENWNKNTSATITFDRYFKFSKKYSRIKDSNIPKPTLTFLEVEDNKVQLYGIGMPKYHSLKVKVWNEYRNWCVVGCSTSWEKFEQEEKAQNVQIAVYREDGAKITEVWNDSPTGKWKKTIDLSNKIQAGDEIYATVRVFDEFRFKKLHWWHDTFENVTFKVNPVVSKRSNYLQIPFTNNAEKAIREKESTFDSIQRKGVVHTWCDGMYMQNYDSIGSHGDSAIMYNEEKEKAYLVTGNMWKSYYQNGGCKAFRAPAMDQDRTGKLNGDYQKFEKATIYWADKYEKAKPGIVRGKIREYYETKKGTRGELKWPQGSEWSETSSCGKKGTVQNFEKARAYSSYHSYHIKRGKLFDAYTKKKGGVKGDLGWPSSTISNEWIGGHYTTTATFEKGQLWAGAVSYIKTVSNGCPTQRENDTKNGAPQDAIDSIHAKEDELFEFYTRKDGYLGEVHKYCSGWMVDYSDVVYKDDSEGGYDRLMYNPITKKTYELHGSIASYYFSKGGCNEFGLPTADDVDIGGIKKGIRKGFGYSQVFTKGDIYHYSEPKEFNGHVVYTASVKGLFREEYNRLKDEFDYSKAIIEQGKVTNFPIGEEESPKTICGTSGKTQQFTESEIHVLNSTTVTSISQGHYTAYKDQGGFGKLGYALSSSYKIYSNQGTTEYIQDFSNGYISSNQKTDFTARTFIDKCNTIEDNFIVDLFKDGENIFDIVQKNDLIDNDNPRDGSRYKGLFIWYHEYGARESLRGNASGSEIYVSHIGIGRKKALEISYMAALQDFIEEQRERASKSQIRIAILQFQGHDMSDEYASNLMFQLELFEAEDLIKEKRDEMNNQTYQNPSKMTKLDYKLTVNNYLIYSQSENLRVRVLWESTKLIVNAGITNLDYAAEGLVNGVKQCGTDIIGSLEILGWSEDSKEARENLGQFLFEFNDFVGNVDLLLYMGSDGEGQIEGASEQDRARMFGHGIATVLCYTADIWVPKVAKEISKTAAFKSFSLAMKELSATKLSGLNNALKELSRAAKVDDIIAALNRVNNLPDELIYKLRVKSYIKKGYIIENITLKDIRFRAKRFSQLTEASEKAEVIYIVEQYKGKVGLIMEQNQAGSKWFEFMVYDADISELKGIINSKDFAVEVKHLQPGSSPTRVNANVLEAFEKFEYYKLPVDEAYVALSLDKHTMSIEQAIKRLGDMQIQKYPVSVTKNGVYKWYTPKK